MPDQPPVVSYCQSRSCPLSAPRHSSRATSTPGAGHTWSPDSRGGLIHGAQPAPAPRHAPASSGPGARRRGARRRPGVLLQRGALVACPARHLAESPPWRRPTFQGLWPSQSVAPGGGGGGGRVTMADGSGQRRCVAGPRGRAHVAARAGCGEAGEPTCAGRLLASTGGGGRQSAILPFCTSVDNTKVTIYHLISQAGWNWCNVGVHRLSKRKAWRPVPARPTPGAVPSSPARPARPQRKNVEICIV